MQSLSRTPFKLTNQELLCAAAASVILQRLKELCETQTVASFCEKPQYGYTEKATGEAVGPRFVRITDIRAGSINWNDVPYCRCDKPESYLLGPGDILVGRTGSVGKSFLVSKVSEPAVYASYLIRLRPKNGPNNRYLYWCLQSSTFWDQILEMTRGSAIKNINGKMLSALRFPIPDRQLQEAVVTFLDGFSSYVAGDIGLIPPVPQVLEEQRRIVAKIEKLAAKIEEAECLRKQTNYEIEAFSKSFESAAFHRFSGRYTQEPLKDLISMSSGKQLNKAELDDSYEFAVYGGGGYVGRYNRFLFEDAKIGIGRVGARCGCVYLTEPNAWITDNSLYVTEYSDRLDMDYLVFALRSLDLRKQANQSAQPVVSQKRINPLRIPVPPKKEQRRIIRYLNDLEAKVDSLKQLQSQTAAELDALLPSILDKAFKGEL